MECCLTEEWFMENKVAYLKNDASVVEFKLVFLSGLRSFGSYSHVHGES